MPAATADSRTIKNVRAAISSVRRSEARIKRTATNRATASRRYLIAESEALRKVEALVSPTRKAPKPRTRRRAKKS